MSPRSSLEDIAAANDNSLGSRLATAVSPDPEKAALVFVAENQKLAESQLKNLKDEESKLNARLLKVQAGIKRWESLVEGLNKAKEVSRRSRRDRRRAELSAPTNSHRLIPDQTLPSFRSEIEPRTRRRIGLPDLDGPHAAWTDESRFLVASWRGSSKIWSGGPDSMTRP